MLVAELVERCDKPTDKSAIHHELEVQMSAKLIPVSSLSNVPTRLTSLREYGISTWPVKQPAGPPVHHIVASGRNSVGGNWALTWNRRELDTLIDTHRQAPTARL